MTDILSPETRALLNRVDHTCLKPTARWEDIRLLAREALTYHTASVCIPPVYVEKAHQSFGASLNICTVVGFPLGYQTSKTKAAEALELIRKGASEIDMVIQSGWVQDSRFEDVLAELLLLREVCEDRILKIIVETCYLEAAQKKQLCQLVAQSGADFIKTSTGFGPAGAAIEDIRLFRKLLPAQVRIKAAGGIHTRQQAEAFVAAGADRIGASSVLADLIKN
ncbi:MAG: deoxyribose-phosphate aldolase [Oscillospiraceae bacterium]|nr:deoxyribose-phosphate aldolase [Oscillospiraceae bacterium]MDD4367706.1 deoxyribose-phosphate aldolase [Oscillospiraceae bacterium]